MFSLLRQRQKGASPTTGALRNLGNPPLPCSLLRATDRFFHPGRAEDDAKVTLADRIFPFRRPQCPVADPPFPNAFYRIVIRLFHLRISISDKGPVDFIEINPVCRLIPKSVVHQICRIRKRESGFFREPLRHCGKFVPFVNRCAKFLWIGRKTRPLHEICAVIYNGRTDTGRQAQLKRAIHQSRLFPGPIQIVHFDAFCSEII
ncbi:hypothetical protein D3C74_291390 [compost metagenome]